jgi:hypothetical protein
MFSEAKYFNSTRPMSRGQHLVASPTPQDQVRSRWVRAGAIAYRAGSDDTSSEEDVSGLNEDEAEKARERNRRSKKEREKYAKVMVRRPVSDP